VGELVSLANSRPRLSTPGISCPDMGYAIEESLVFGYTGGPPVVVRVDRNCDVLATADHTRYLGSQAVLDAFYDLYRAQLRATTPVATIPTPACPATYDPGAGTATAFPKDGIGRNRALGQALLPDPLAATVACRYEPAGTTWVLTRQEQRRTDLEPARIILNQQYAHRENPGCLDTLPGAMRPTLVDSLWIADTTGAVTEVRVWRQPCAVVHTASSSLAPVPALLTYLNGMLGTPP
jgi:hypothetical protein